MMYTASLWDNTGDGTDDYVWCDDTVASLAASGWPGKLSKSQVGGIDNIGTKAQTVDMTTTTLQRATEFFYEHAGWSYLPGAETPEEGRVRCARILAGAEHWAREVGVTFRWHPDAEGDHSTYETDEQPTTCEGCVAWYRGDVVASLWCIDDADDNYRRVIEAELASEAKDAMVAS